jgi:flagellar assembly protein FliH
MEGGEKAFQEMKAAMVERMNSLEKLLKRIEDLKGQLLIDNEAALVKLSFLIAKKIAYRDLEEHHEAAREILKSVVGEVQADEKVVVRLSHEDMGFLETLQTKSGEKIEGLERVKLVSQDGIKSGGCLIETEFGSVNATVEERVDRIWQTLQARMPQKRQENNEE